MNREQKLLESLNENGNSVTQFTLESESQNHSQTTILLYFFYFFVDSVFVSSILFHHFFRDFLRLLRRFERAC